MLYIRGAGFIAAGAILWMIYFDLKDSHRPEPRRMLALAFLVGCGAALLGLGAYRALAWAGLPALPSATTLGIFVYCFALVGPIEEGAKFICARTLIFRWSHFDEPIDGMVYAAAVAIGFASVENLLYTPFLPWPEQLARAVSSPITHSLFAAIWGFGTARAFFVCRTRLERLIWQIAPLLLSMALHGLYDFFLLAYNATYLAGAIILVLWIGLILNVRRLRRLEGRGAGVPPQTARSI